MVLLTKGTQRIDAATSVDVAYLLAQGFVRAAAPTHPVVGVTSPRTTDQEMRSARALRTGHIDSGVHDGALDLSLAAHHSTVPHSTLQGVQPVQDFYGFDVVQVSTFTDIPPGSALVPAQVGGAIIQSSALVTRLGGTLGQRFIQWLIGAATGTRLAWGSLPSWLRSGMALVGLSGATIVIDQATEGPIQIRPFGGGLETQGLDIQVGRYYDGRIITKTWVANGIQFWATGTGKDLMHHVLKLDGSIKSWKPPRPVVLMPGGAKNIRDLLRADDIVDRQLKKVGKAIRRRTPAARKPKGPQQVVIVDPQHAALH